MTTQTKLEKLIDRNGYIATLRRSKKKRVCRVCDTIIEAGTRYYSVRWRHGVDVNPHSVCIEHINPFLDSKHESWVEWLRLQKLTEQDLENYGASK